MPNGVVSSPALDKFSVSRITELQLTGSRARVPQKDSKSFDQAELPNVYQRIYTLNDAGVLTCGDTATGQRLWQIRLKGPFSATPLAAGQHLYFVNEKGLAQVVDPTKGEGEVIGELDLGEAIIGTPSMGSGAIFFRSDGHLWKLSKS